MPRPGGWRPCLLDVVTRSTSEGTQCHNMVHAFIGDVSLPARRKHVEWRGEPVVEIPGKYVVQGQPTSHCSAGVQAPTC